MKNSTKSSGAIFSPISADDIEEMKEPDVISSMVLEFGREFPCLLTTLITERDMHMSSHILNLVAQRRKDRQDRILIDEVGRNERIAKIEQSKDLIHTKCEENVVIVEHEEFTASIQPKDKYFVVVGLGHVAGMKKYLLDSTQIVEPKPLNPISCFNRIAWILPVIILFVAGFCYIIMRFRS